MSSTLRADAGEDLSVVFIPAGVFAYRAMDDAIVLYSVKFDGDDDADYFFWPLSWWLAMEGGPIRIRDRTCEVRASLARASPSAPCARTANNINSPPTARPPANFASRCHSACYNVYFFANLEN